MRRSRLISLILYAALLFPVPLRAQQNPVIGFLTSGSMASLNEQWIGAFHKGLA